MIAFKTNIFIILYVALTFMCVSCSHENESSPITWDECGGNVEDHACDFSLMDQPGNEWSLYDHYGNIIILDFSATWCGVCQNAAKVAQSVQDEYKDDGVVWVTILLQNNYGLAPTLADLTEWASAFGMHSSPVLSGNADLIDETAQDGFNVQSWPGFVVIDRELKIAYELYGWNEMQIKYWIKNMLDAEADNNMRTRTSH